MGAVRLFLAEGYLLAERAFHYLHQSSPQSKDGAYDEKVGSMILDLAAKCLKSQAQFCVSSTVTTQEVLYGVRSLIDGMTAEERRLDGPHHRYRDLGFYMASSPLILAVMLNGVHDDNIKGIERAGLSRFSFRVQRFDRKTRRR